MREINFEQAWTLARENNRSLKLLRMEYQNAELKVKEAYSAAMPVVSATGSYSYNFLIPELKNKFTMDGQEMEFKMALSKEHNYYAGITLEQPLWVAGKVGIGLKIAQIYHDISALSVKQGEADLKMAVTQAFYGSLLAKEYYNLTLDTENQIKKHLENVKAMFEQGVVSDYDRLRAEVELANFHPQVTQAEEAWKLSLEGLRILLGLPAEEEFIPTGTIDEFVPLDLDIGKTVELAFANRPDLRQLDQQKQMLLQLLKLEKRNQYWPNLFFSATLQRQAQEEDLNFKNYFWSDGLSGGIGIQIPLFDGFRTSARIQQNKVNLKKQEILLDQVKEGVRMEVKEAVWDLQQAVDKLTASRQAVVQADKGYAIAEVRYASGISTQVELLDARLAGTQAKIGELSALFDLVSAKAALDHAVGK
jgi:outer membrane protein TolC